MSTTPPASRPGTASTLHSVRFRLGYNETDAAQVLYFAAWFPWMERLHIEWLFDNGLRFDQSLEKFGVIGAVRATTCDYLLPARVYDEIEIRMHCDELRERSYRLGFQMARTDDDAVVARSTMSMVYLDAAGIPTAIPEQIRTALTA